ncbi:MAG: DUF975 family protein [Firmicutes bacterium]|nr:DUF975 family protein [Bacillota bacterium]
MFTAAECRQVARQALSGKWASAILVSFLAMLVCAGVSPYSNDISDMLADNILNKTVLYFPVNFKLILAVASLLFSAAFILGAALFFIRIVSGGEPGVKTLFSRFSIWPKAFGLYLFIGLFIFLWSLLLIVPGIIAAFRYSMAFYLMAENPDMGIRESVSRSKQMMHGHKGRLFCLWLSFIGWALLSVVTCGIGFFFLIPYVDAATAAFYLNLQNRVTLSDMPQAATPADAAEETME